MSETIHIAQIPWSPRFETGVAELDDDHRHLIGLLNQLGEAIGKPCRQTTLEILAGIEAFVLEHFAREEAMFEQVDYALAEQHRDEHRQIHKEIGLQLEDLYEADYSLNSVAFFLHNWLVKHITGSDRHLALAIAAARPSQTTCAA